VISPSSLHFLKFFFFKSSFLSNPKLLAYDFFPLSLLFDCDLINVFFPPGHHFFQPFSRLFFSRFFAVFFGFTQDSFCVKTLFFSPSVTDWNQYSLFWFWRSRNVQILNHLSVTSQRCLLKSHVFPLASIFFSAHPPPQASSWEFS